MFDYTRNLRLALTDKARRAGLMAGAGAVLFVAAGFLLAALWTWLAHHLHWGPLGASLAIGGAFLVVAIIMLVMAKTERHPTPSTDDLRAEVEQRLSSAADAAVSKVTVAADTAMDRASDKAVRLMDLAEQRAHSMADSLSYKADRFADRAEARVHGAARRMGERAAGSVGLGPEVVDQVMDRARGASQSRAAPLLPLLGAVAAGITLASRFQAWRHRDDDPDDDMQGDDWDDGDWDDRRR